jgi:hypothetical protein
MVFQPCKLCGKSAALLQSHVMPAFVFKWLKEAGHIRFAETPNRRTQDGHKRGWLCRECEDILNSGETPFANKIFHPYDADPKIKVRYHEWMLLFCASIAWRTLLYMREESHLADLSQRHIVLADEALQTWSRFLLGKYKHTGIFEIHLLPLGEIGTCKGINLSPNINRYFLRGVDMDIGSSSSVCFSYSKLGPFAIFGFIEKQQQPLWKGSKISERHGWFSPRDYVLPVE